MISRLSFLLNLSYEYVDHVLIVTLTEKWHLKTNIFLPMSEMTITLNDVNNLLHLLLKIHNEDEQTKSWSYGDREPCHGDV